jgi:hypothetical protein
MVLNLKGLCRRLFKTRMIGFYCRAAYMYVPIAFEACWAIRTLIINELRNQSGMISA